MPFCFLKYFVREFILQKYECKKTVNWHPSLRNAGSLGRKGLLWANHCKHMTAFTQMPQWLKDYEQSPVEDNSEFPCVKKKYLKKINRSTTNLHNYAIDPSNANSLLVCLYNKFTAKTTLHIPYAFNLALDCWKCSLFNASMFLLLGKLLVEHIRGIWLNGCATFRIKSSGANSLRM